MWSSSSPSPLSAKYSPRQRYAPLPGFAVNPIVYDPEIHRRWRVGQTRDEMNTIRSGVQVHAVPENERAYDSAGRRLPWGYTYADSERRYPEEKGPFGKSTSLRGISRSRTYTPARKEDQAKLDNIRAADDVVNKWKASLRDRNKTSDDTRDRPLVAIDPNVASNPQTTVAKEPTEVILYGFGSETQWAAIAFYEKASQGIIYEDYDRTPPHTRFDHTFANSASRAASLSRLSQAALRKKNTYVGGDHWIKVTFDSPESADSACRTSPHKVCGYLVYAERFRGVGPEKDVPIFVTPDGEVVGTESPPNSQSTSTMSGALPDSPESSATASSATATATATAPEIRILPSARPVAGAWSPPPANYPDLRRTGGVRYRHPLAQTQNADEPTEPAPLLNHLHLQHATTDADPPSARNLPATRYRVRNRKTDDDGDNEQDDDYSLPQSPTPAPGGTASSSSAPRPAFNPPPPRTPIRPGHALPGTLRIRGAKPIALAPATSAVLPTQPAWKLFLATMPLLGIVFTVLLGVLPPDATASGAGGGRGGGGKAGSSSSLDVIGSQVPRRDEDGAFDWEGASLWWRVCWWLDRWLWTDLCGMKGED